MATLQNSTIPNSGTFGSISDPDAISIDSNGKVKFDQEVQTKKFWGITKVADFGSGSGVNHSSWYNAVALSSLETNQLYYFDAYHSHGNSLYWGEFWVMKTASSTGWVDKIFPRGYTQNHYQGQCSSTHVQFKEINSGWNGPTHYGRYYKVFSYYSS